MTRRLPVRTYCEKAPLSFSGRKKGLLWWHTTVTAKTKTSRQKQKHHGKTKNLTAKTKYLTAKPKTSRQNKIPHGKTKYLTAKPNTSQQKQNSFGYAVRYLVFAVKYFMLVLP